MVSGYILADTTMTNTISLPGIHFQCLASGKVLSKNEDYLEHVFILGNQNLIQI